MWPDDFPLVLEYNPIRLCLLRLGLNVFRAINLRRRLKCVGENVTSRAGVGNFLELFLQWAGPSNIWV